MGRRPDHFTDVRIVLPGPVYFRPSPATRARLDRELLWRVAGGWVLFALLAALVV